MTVFVQYTSCTKHMIKKFINSIIKKQAVRFFSGKADKKIVRKIIMHEMQKCLSVSYHIDKDSPAVVADQEFHVRKS